MSLALRHGGATKAVSKLHLRHGGATKEVMRLWLRQGGVTELIYASLDSTGTDSGSGAGGTAPGISADPTDVGGSASSSSSSITITSRYTTVTVTGGVAPYTHSWTQVSGDVMTATDPSSSTTAFYASVPPSESLSADWRDTVTDAGGSTATVDVTVQLINRGGTL